MSTDLEGTVIVSAADSGYFNMLAGLLRSLDRHAVTRDTPKAVFDLGLEPTQRIELEGMGVELLRPRAHFGVEVEGAPPIVPGVLVRPFLRDYLPDHECHIWLDADAWVQDPSALLALRSGALREGMAIVHESEASYVLPPLLRAWFWKHAVLGLGALSAMRTLARPMLNAGVFAVHADAPHNAVWRRRYAHAIARTGRAAPYDQFTLNAAIWLDGLPTAILEPHNNWICDRALPLWDSDRRMLCVPREPFEPLAIVHLAGHLKTAEVAVRTTKGEERNMRLGFGRASA